MFENQKFLTRGVENEIPIVADQPHVAHGFDDGSAEEKDYLQVFNADENANRSAHRPRAGAAAVPSTSLMCRVTMP